ncbi:glycosyltransferase family 2 protein [Candidatus Symbiobacter mobilis]|uniref:Beta-monoglucosyldiacylglycerol synthase n=1 Tax=Candidatus Symbiobacter mobilis CR TaxID=946483 RepID=U5N885_9BURK|nr:glycosyltransferase [Candidatus Symbiobacter mobilis]AGX86478.1 cell wall biogenesis glycosyltransferase [Candidatus Symbiobacter mobilis CR]
MLRYAVAFLVVFGLGWLLVASYQTVSDEESSLAALFEGYVLSLVSLYLLVFLSLLVLRYAVLIFYSFLDHIESLYKVRASTGPLYREEESLPMVSVVVPAYNEGVVIQPALRALLVLDYPNYEIIVVDDGSTDDTYEKAMAVARESRTVRVRVVTKRNGGKAEALNTGMTLARGEFVLNMDGDTKLSRNTLRVCVRHFENPAIGAVAGNVKVLNRENVWTNIQSLEYIEGLAMARKAQSFIRSVNIIPGPIGLFRKSVLQQVGGYDHDTFAEDCDLTLKMLMRGWHIAYEPNAIAWVESPSRLLDLIKQRYRWTRGILQAISKHSHALWSPRKSGINCFILWYMLFEGIMWPFSTLLGNLFFVYVSLSMGLASLLFFWWLQLTMLDVVAAAYCVIVEEEDPAMILYAVMFRLFYINITDISKVFATIEEWRGKSMTWGKLDREGKL